MKRLYILLIFIGVNTNLLAQFKLSGTIKHYTGHAELKINIPQVYGFDDANSIHIPVAKNGSFSISLPVKNAKFADLIFQQNFHLMLLSAGKSLKVQLSENDKTFTVIAGTALAENVILQKVNIEEYPFFLQNDANYTALNPAELNSKLLKPYFVMRDKKIATVSQSAISIRDKKLIVSELKSAAYNNLYELILLDGQSHENITNLVVGAFDQANAEPDVLPAGPQYYLFANHYLWYKQFKSSAKVKAQRIKANQPMPDYGITVAEFNNYSNQYGTIYLRWLTATKFLPNPIVEQLGYQLVLNAIKTGNKSLIDELAKNYKRKFGNSKYNANIRKQIAGLKH